MTERATVSQFRDLEPGVQYAAFNAAVDAKAGAALLHGGTIGLRGLYRNGRPYVLAPINGQYPWVPPGGGAGVGHRAVRRRRRPLLVQRVDRPERHSARLFGAKAGDIAELRRWSDGGLTKVTVAGIVPDERLPAEMVLPTSTASAIGFVRPTSVQIYGYRSVKAVDEALANHGLRRSDVRIGHPNTDPTSPTRRSACWRPRSSSGSSGTCPAATAP